MEKYKEIILAIITSITTIVVTYISVNKKNK